MATLAEVLNQQQTKRVALVIKLQNEAAFIFEASRIYITEAELTTDPIRRDACLQTARNCQEASSEAYRAARIERIFCQP